MANDDNGCGAVAAVVAAIITAVASLLISFISMLHGCSIAEKAIQNEKAIANERNQTQKDIESERRQTEENIANQEKATKLFLAKREEALRLELQEKNAQLSKELEILKARHKQLSEKIEPYCKRLMVAVDDVQLQFAQLIKFADSRPMGEGFMEKPIYVAFERLADVQTEGAAIYLSESVDESIRAFQDFALNETCMLSKDTTDDQRSGIIAQARVHHANVKSSISVFIKSLREGDGVPPDQPAP